MPRENTTPFESSSSLTVGAAWPRRHHGTQNHLLTIFKRCRTLEELTATFWAIHQQLLSRAEAEGVRDEQYNANCTAPASAAVTAAQVELDEYHLSRVTTSLRKLHNAICMTVAVALAEAADLHIARLQEARRQASSLQGGAAGLIAYVNIGVDGKRCTSKCSHSRHQM